MVVRVEREGGRVEVWRVFLQSEKGELSALFATLFATLGKDGVVVAGSKVAELERELRAKDLVRIEFVVTDGDPEDREARGMVVWVKERSPLWFVLAEQIGEVLKKKAVEAMAPKEPMEPMEPEGLKKRKTEPKEAMETEVPKELMEPKAERAARLRARAREVEEEARRAAEAALEAEEAAEEEEAERRAAERKETEQKLELAIDESRRAAETVDDLRRQLEQQTELERRKRKRPCADAEAAAAESGEGRRVAARKEAVEADEIVMVEDREFKEVMGAYDGAVHYVEVERFERRGPRGIGPARGGEIVRESVYGDGAEVEELQARFAARAGSGGDDGEGDGGVVVVTGYTGVRKFDAAMEENKFVRRALDVHLRCMNPGGPAEPEWGEDTERVWVKRGSVELAALDKLIANARARKRQWQWQCPPSPPYRPVRPVRQVRPEPVDDDDDEMGLVD
jgi:hypothetical protein